MKALLIFLISIPQSAYATNIQFQIKRIFDPDGFQMISLNCSSGPTCHFIKNYGDHEVTGQAPVSEVNAMLKTLTSIGKPNKDCLAEKANISWSIQLGKLNTRSLHCIGDKSVVPLPILQIETWVLSRKGSQHRTVQ